MELKNRRILLVDDSTDIVDLVSLWLRRAGADIMAANSAADAVALLERGPLPEIILCDIGMPDEDGYAFIARIQVNPAWSAIPVLALTAYANESEAKRILAAGFERHLAKPIEPQILIKAVLGVLKARAVGDGEAAPPSEGMITDL